MSDNSRIEWTDATWNPIGGCSRVSPGCENCYAEREAIRTSGVGRRHQGLVRSTERGPRWTNVVRLFEDRLDQPLRWRRSRRVFVNSMSDLFHPDVADQWIERIWTVMGRSPQHTFQILTKRPDRMRRFVEANLGCTLPNVWLGVSVEDQERADERVPLLLQTPAAVRFLSAEPLLGPVLFASQTNSYLRPLWGGAGIDWVIVGGESGRGARPLELAWIRSIRDQCAAAGVACFVKQLGQRWSCSALFEGCMARTAKGADPQHWPADLRVREFPR